MIKKLLFCAIVSLVMGGGSALAADTADYQVVPLPQSVVLQKGEPFVLADGMAIACPGNDEAMKRNAQFLADYLADIAGIKTTLAFSSSIKGKGIRLVLDKKVKGDEAYTLTVDKKSGVTIAAATPKGVFYGIQTLRK